MSTPAHALGDRLEQSRIEDQRRAFRALLMEPLLHADRPAYALVKRHSDWLSGWLAAETRWSLIVESDFARLIKAAPAGDDGSRMARSGPRPGDPAFTRRRYALLCLVLAGLERGESQATLGRLGAAAVEQAANPVLAERGLRFELRTQDERRDLVAVVRLLLGLGVLARVAGSEESYIRNSERDVLYDIDRRVLSAMLITRRGPSWVAGLEQAPEGTEARLDATAAHLVADTPEARTRDIRRRLTERLLDDPVLYLEQLDEDERAYLAKQRHVLVQRIHEATGLIPEIRAEGLAMVDESGDLTDLPIPSEGTEGHLVLLLADRLAGQLREAPDEPLSWSDLIDDYRGWVETFGRYWKKAAKADGAPLPFLQQSAERLSALGLARVEGDGVLPLPAVARYAVLAPKVVKVKERG